MYWHEAWKTKSVKAPSSNQSIDFTCNRLIGWRGLKGVVAWRDDAYHKASQLGATKAFL